MGAASGPVRRPTDLTRRPIITSMFFSMAPVPWVSSGRAAGETWGRSRSAAVMALACRVK